MQSQHGVPSTLTAAPMYGQYGDSLLTAAEQAVPALCPHRHPHCLSVQRSVKCHNRWSHPVPHHHRLFTDCNRCMRNRRCVSVSCIHVCLCKMMQQPCKSQLNQTKGKDHLQRRHKDNYTEDYISMKATWRSHTSQICNIQTRQI